MDFTLIAIDRRGRAVRSGTVVPGQERLGTVPGGPVRAGTGRRNCVHPKTLHHRGMPPPSVARHAGSRLKEIRCC
jgi:hypothetical protein